MTTAHNLLEAHSLVYWPDTADGKAHMKASICKPTHADVGFSFRFTGRLKINQTNPTPLWFYQQALLPGCVYN